VPLGDKKNKVAVLRLENRVQKLQVKVFHLAKKSLRKNKLTVLLRKRLFKNSIFSPEQPENE